MSESQRARVQAQFGPSAAAYVASAGHAGGPDLEWLLAWGRDAGGASAGAGRRHRGRAHRAGLRGASPSRVVALDRHRARCSGRRRRVRRVGASAAGVRVRRLATLRACPSAAGAFGTVTCRIAAAPLPHTRLAGGARGGAGAARRRGSFLRRGHPGPRGFESAAAVRHRRSSAAAIPSARPGLPSDAGVDGHAPGRGPDHHRRGGAARRCGRGPSGRARTRMSAEALAPAWSATCGWPRPRGAGRPFEFRLTGNAAESRSPTGCSCFAPTGPDDARPLARVSASPPSRPTRPAPADRRRSVPPRGARPARCARSPAGCRCPCPWMSRTSRRPRAAAWVRYSSTTERTSPRGERVEIERVLDRENRRIRLVHDHSLAHPPAGAGGAPGPLSRDRSAPAVSGAPGCAIRRCVCCAIISSSLVGMTHAVTRLPAALMRGPPFSFAARSSSTPSHAASRQIAFPDRRRCSPRCRP